VLVEVADLRAQLRRGEVRPVQHRQVGQEAGAGLLVDGAAVGRRCGLQPAVADRLAVVRRGGQPLFAPGEIDGAALDAPERTGGPVQPRHQRTHPRSVPDRDNAEAVV
jgi:hypothetical protein